jgi:hypothetical protein
LFVNLKTNAMPGGMRKGFGHASFAEDAASGFVNIAAGNAGAHRRYREFLCFEYCFIGFAFVRFWRAEAYRTRHVGAVTLTDYTEVEGYESPARQGGCRGFSVGQSGAFPRSHDRFETHAIGTVQASLMLEFRGNLDLANSGTDDTEDVLKKFAADKSCFRHELELVFVFDEAEWLHKRRGKRNEKGAAKFGRQLGTKAR